MTTKAAKKPPAAKEPAKAPDNDRKRIALSELGEAERKKIMAQEAFRPTCNAAVIANAFTKNTIGAVDYCESIDVLMDQCAAVKKGNLGRVEAMLVSQAHSLDVLFASLARKAAGNMGEYLGAAETYMKLALRAQSQCRATLETLATIKNPPVVFAKQANIAHGHQQVNNGIPAHAGETEGEQPELSRLGHEQGQSLDGGAAATAGGSHPAVATVEAIHRPAQRRRQGRIKP